MIAAKFEQSGSVIAGYQSVRLAGFGQCQQKCIMRISYDRMSLSRQVNQNRPLQLFDQRADSMSLQNTLELGIAAGASDLLDLVGAGDEFKAGFSPGLINEMWWGVR